MTVSELIKSLKELEEQGYGDYEAMVEDRVNLNSPMYVEKVTVKEPLKEVLVQSMALEVGDKTLEEDLMERFMNQ